MIVTSASHMENFGCVSSGQERLHPVPKLWMARVCR